MKDILNRRIKHREIFRPFAPSMLEEATGEYFEKTHPSPFMTFAYSVRPEKRAVIPAPTHVDGTARLQTVSRTANPLYWRLIRAFGDLTGVPVVLNTSFNDNEPIVCRPEEALDCFQRTQMDVLVMGDFILEKKVAPPQEADADLPKQQSPPPQPGRIDLQYRSSSATRPEIEFTMHILLLNEYYPPDTSATAKMAVQVAETLAQKPPRHRPRRAPFLRSRRILSLRLSPPRRSQQRDRRTRRLHGPTRAIKMRAPRLQLSFVSRARRSARACAFAPTWFSP